jgi:hypothetical protein
MLKDFINEETEEAETMGLATILTKKQAEKEAMEARQEMKAEEVGNADTLPTQHLPEVFGVAEDIESTDIVLPRALLMHGVSKFMKQKEIGARLGEIRNSFDGSLLGDEDVPFEVIIFKLVKIWREYEVANGEKNYIGQQVVTIKNSGLTWKETLSDGRSIERDYCYQFYCIGLRDGKPMELPFVIEMSRTSANCARTICSIFKGFATLRKSSVHTTIFIGSELKSGDKGKASYYVYKSKQGRPTNNEEIELATKWYETFKAGALKAHEMDEAKEEPTVTF